MEEYGMGFAACEKPVGASGRYEQIMAKGRNGSLHPVVVSDGMFDGTALALLSLDKILFTTGVTPPAKVIAVAVGCDPEAVEDCDDEDELTLLCVHEVIDQWLNERAGDGDKREFAEALVERMSRILHEEGED